MDYQIEWYPNNKDALCRQTPNLQELMRLLTGQKLLSRSKQDQIDGTAGDDIRCEKLYDYLTRHGELAIGKIIECLKQSHNHTAANIYEGARLTLGFNCALSTNPRASVLICDIVRNEATARVRWPLVACRILSEPERNVSQQMEINSVDHVLFTLDKFFDSGRDVCQLLEAIRDEGLHTLADRIINEGHRMTWSIAYKSRIEFNVGDEVYNFTGREEELIALHRMLKRAHVSYSKSISANLVCVTGLGGVGKTALVRNYALRYFFHGNVIWLNARSVTSLSASFLRLEEECGSPAGEGTSVIEKLRTSTLKSLFVFDDVEDMTHLRHFPPFLSLLHTWTYKPYVLLTSRKRNLVPMWENQLNVSPLSEGDAARLIRTKLIAPGTKEVETLATRMGRLPLALQQAVSYISRTANIIPEDQTCIAQFLGKLAESERKLLNDDKFLNDVGDYSETTFTTWERTMSVIGKGEGGEMAMEMLNMLSYMCPVTSHRLLGMIWPESVNPPLNCLKWFSMVDVSSTTGETLVAIHCMVQSVTRLKLPEEIESQIVRLCTQSLSTRLSNRSNSLTGGCVSHAQHLLPFQLKHLSKLPEDEIANFVQTVRGLQVDGVIIAGLNELIEAVRLLEV